MSDITILSCPICNYPKLREYGNGIYQCDFCETYFDQNENIILTEQEWLQTASTEQLAEWIAKQKCDGCNDEPYDDKHGTCKYCMTKKTEQIREWLKQPHREVDKQNEQTEVMQ